MKNLFLIILLFQASSIFGQADWSRSNSCEYKNFNNSDLIEQLINGMSVEEKVGQVIQGDLDFISPEDVQQFKIGSILNGGNTAPNGDKYRDADCKVQDNTNPATCKSFAAWGCGVWREGEYGQPKPACTDTKYMLCSSSQQDPICCKNYNDSTNCSDSNKWCTVGKSCVCKDPNTS